MQLESYQPIGDDSEAKTYDVTVQYVLGRNLARLLALGFLISVDQQFFFRFSDLF